VTHTAVVLCSPGVAPGFELAGVPVVRASGGDDAVRRLEEIRGRPGLGLILVENGLYETLEEGGAFSGRRGALPAVVPFPGPAWAERPPTESYVVDLLHRAVGYRVRLR
jgi:vacuolar-type H+-ATPase subunit F/Vma7